MPRIEAPTVKEHRQQVLNSLIDAAEEVLLTEGVDALTAEAVSSRAGRARNSIYRYVSSVDELRLLVLERYLPQWKSAIADGLKNCNGPTDEIISWSKAALQQAAITGHGWLMSVMGHRRANISHQFGEGMNKRVYAIHQTLMVPLYQAWGQISSEDAKLGSLLTIQMVAVGMRQIDHGAPAESVIEKIGNAVGAAVSSFSK